MIRKKKILIEETMPEFDAGIAAMEEDSKIFVDKSLEIAHFIYQVMEAKGMKQRDLAEKMGKSEAEISKLLGGMHNYTLRSIAKMEAALGTTIVCTPGNKKVLFPKTNLQVTSYAITEKRVAVVSLAIGNTGKLFYMNQTTPNTPLSTQAI